MIDHLKTLVEQVDEVMGKNPVVMQRLAELEAREREEEAYENEMADRWRNMQ